MIYTSINSELFLATFLVPKVKAYATCSKKISYSNF